MFKKESTDLRDLLPVRKNDAATIICSDGVLRTWFEYVEQSQVALILDNHDATLRALVNMYPELEEEFTPLMPLGDLEIDEKYYKKYTRFDIDIFVAKKIKMSKYRNLHEKSKYLFLPIDNDVLVVTCYDGKKYNLREYIEALDVGKTFKNLQEKRDYILNDLYDIQRMTKEWIEKSIIFDMNSCIKASTVLGRELKRAKDLKLNKHLAVRFTCKDGYQRTLRIYLKRMLFVDTDINTELQAFNKMKKLCIKYLTKSYIQDNRIIDLETFVSEAPRATDIFDLGAVSYII